MAGIFPRKRALVAMLMLALVPMMADAAGITIPNWGSPPAACLPNRVGTNSGCNGDTCYCPPSSFCPNPNVCSWAQFLSDSQMPPALTLACCPLPTCPSGTKFAGQVLPADENCSPPDVCTSVTIQDPPNTFVPDEYYPVTPPLPDAQCSAGPASPKPLVNPPSVSPPTNNSSPFVAPPTTGGVGSTDCSRDILEFLGGWYCIPSRIAPPVGKPFTDSYYANHPYYAATYGIYGSEECVGGITNIGSNCPYDTSGSGYNACKNKPGISEMNIRSFTGWVTSSLYVRKPPVQCTGQRWKYIGRNTCNLVLPVRQPDDTFAASTSGDGKNPSAFEARACNPTCPGSAVPNQVNDPDLTAGYSPEMDNSTKCGNNPSPKVGDVCQTYCQSEDGASGDLTPAGPTCWEYYKYVAN
jgi:hypothetical protein